MPQVYLTRFPPALAGTQTTVRLQEADPDRDKCGTATVQGGFVETGSTVTYPTGYEKNVKNKVVLIRGAECQFSPLYKYDNDFSNRVEKMWTVGATAVIFAEGFYGKFPQKMFAQASPVPICIIMRSDYEFLKANVFAGSPEAAFDLSQTAMLTGTEDDQIPNPWSTMTITESAPPLELAVPLMTALFNPERLNEIEAPVVMAQMAESCMPQLTEETFAYQFFPKCIPCWAMESASFTNMGDMTDKIVFLPNDKASICYLQYFNMALLAQAAGAKALVYGRHNDDTGTIAGPVVISGDLQIPYFWVLNIHSRTIQELLAAVPEGGALRLRLPALQGRAGPPFFSAPTTELGPTTIDIWMASPTEFGMSHLECEAGQAQYNPLSFHGTVLGDPNSYDPHPKGVKARASTLCGSSLNCSACLMRSQLDVDDQVHDDADKAAVLAAVFANAPAQLVGAVIIMDEEEYPCFHSDEQFTRVAQLAGAKAVFLVNSSPYTRTILAPASLRGARYNVPTFDIGRDCWLRFSESMAEGSNPVLVGLPTLVNGSALVRKPLPNDAKLVAEISVIEPSSLRGIYLSGQASFNPDFYPSVIGLVEPLAVKSVCKRATSCSDCDKLDSPFEGPALALTDKIAVVRESDLACLRPISNVVELVEQAGGLGVIVLSASLQVVSLVQDSISHRVGIPAFSIPAGLDKYAGLGHGLLGDASVQLRLPSIVQGVAIPFSRRQDDGGSPGSDNSGRAGGGASKGAKAGIAIAAVVAPTITLVLVFIYRRWYLRRKSYRQFEAGVQTQADAEASTSLLVRNEFNPMAHDMDAGRDVGGIEVSRQPAVHEADLEMYKFKVDK